MITFISVALYFFATIAGSCFGTSEKLAGQKFWLVVSLLCFSFAMALQLYGTYA